MPLSSPPDDGGDLSHNNINTPSKSSRDNADANNDSPPLAVVKPRARANSKREPPTLLGDFLRGKQSPARLAAERKRRQSVELLKAEMRQEMRQGAVRKLQQPGGVRDRVSKWQKANGSAMVDGDPDDAATEPTDLAFNGEDEESVTEADRIRIKLRQGKTGPSKPRQPGGTPAQPSTPPKKRVISDEHWRKKKGQGQDQRSPPRKASPPSKKPSVTPKRLPNHFVPPSGKSPLVASKIKEWAAKVDVTDTPSSPHSHRSSNSRDRSPRVGGVISEAGDSASGGSARGTPDGKLRHDDGIRVRPMQSTSSINDDDGIRVRPLSESSFQALNVGEKKEPKISRSRSKTVSGSSRSISPPSQRNVTRDSTGFSRQIRHQTRKKDGKLDVKSEKDAGLNATPTGSAQRRLSKPLSTEVSGDSNEASLPADEQCRESSACNTASDLASGLADKSVADISEDIPFGHSAFSELDLTVDGQPKSRPKRAKVVRTTSLKSMPKVLKKVVEEGKKIIHEINEPPRPVHMNKPPSIEKWLSSTVDPFVDHRPEAESTADHVTAKKKGKSDGDSSTEAVTPRRRSSNGIKSTQPPSIKRSGKAGVRDQDEPIVQGRESGANPPEAKEEPTTPTSTGLKRSSAVRSSSSPLKSGNGKRQLLGVLREACQGESGVPLPVRPKSYQFGEPSRHPRAEDALPSLHMGKSSTSTSPSSSPSMSTPRLADSTMWHAEHEPDPSFKLAAPRLRPPTRGNHELSTILSEESSSAIESDLSSHVTQSTLTQSTVLTRDSGLSKSKADNAPGLKRRLTKHSDLVSVLSLPDDSTIHDAIKRNRSRPSLRRHRIASVDMMAQDLLREFVDDENLYLRELKTLVDGVVPVLLSHVVSGTSATELFGPSQSGKLPDNVSKSVVSMGISLEKLRSAHKKAPTSDMRKLMNWAHGVVSIYSGYLDAWRLGFDDAVINLAPAAEGVDENDSLLAALPRNEHGDVVNDSGERVAVAHLLKRPLLRVKQLTKLLRCVDSLYASHDTHEILRDFESLQEKSRRRFKEETARIIDEEAINTDTSRCRDLDTLKASAAVSIDPSRQVSAKDVFSLSLSHSSSQKLDCQVEFVHRDNQRDGRDEGDVLIREIGEGRRPYLLFPPISMAQVSARTGDSDSEMVIMARGTSRDGGLWREFFTVRADNEDQILDWLDLLPLHPVPPLDLTSITSRGFQERQPEPPSTPPPHGDEPLSQSAPGTLSAQSPCSPIAKDLPTASPDGAAETVNVASDPDKTPRQHQGGLSLDREGRGRPLKESMRPDPGQLQGQKQAQPPSSEAYREDGAPPPPIHRNLNSPGGPKSGGDMTKTAPSLQPAVKVSHGGDRLKRRTSSPLKHEYLPSDQSSTSDAYSSGESETDSSDDEIESIDIPETELGVSIKSDTERKGPYLMPESECSLTPSHSASQAGLHGNKMTPHEPASHVMARISRWSDKGLWKDILSEPCSILVADGLIEAYPVRAAAAADVDMVAPPLLALDLTPLVLIRQSTAVDLEIRSSVQAHSRLSKSFSGGNFRFRCFVGSDCYSLYMAVHQARLNNQKFIQLENEARFRSFGERQALETDGDTSSRRRSWLGRKNSYRSSVRAPSHSNDGGSTTPSSTPSASSFLKRLTLSGNLSFNIARSFIDRQPRSGSGSNSLYTSGSSSAGGTPPRSPSVSVENSGHHPVNVGADGIRIRLHLLVTAAKWEDCGNCTLQIRRPPPGWRQALRADHGLEKRITVTASASAKREGEEPKVMLDAVLGSGCFSSMGSRGIVCGVWEEVKNGAGVVGMVPENGATGGNIKKWCFQFSSAAEANGVLRLVHQEVVRA